MFGYLTAYRDRLSEEDRKIYDSYYCGLCETLKSKFGLKSELILEYDLVFLGILYSGLYEEEETGKKAFCFMKQKRVEKKLIPSLSFAADMNLLLSYNNYRDRAMDSLNKAADRAAKRLKKDYHLTAKRYARQFKAVEKYMQQLVSYENAPDDNPDRAANLTGEMLSEVFLMKEDEFSGYLRPLFFYLGKFIYLIDAFEDVFEDEEKGSYNPYKSICHEEDFEARAREHLESVAAMAAKYFEMLPIFRYRAILRNILYSGIWLSFGRTVRKRSGKENQEKSEG